MPDTGQLLNAAKASRLIGVSRWTWNRWDDAEAIPAAVQVETGRRFWRRQDLALWLEWGCPKRSVFETRLRLREQNLRRRSRQQIV